MDVDAEKVDRLPYDVDGTKIYLFPFDPKKRFTSKKDDRPWPNIFESKHLAWSGDRYIAKCRGSFECFNPPCPYYLQFHKCNRRQFTPKGACKSCGQFSDRVTCEARKIWEFPGQWGEKIITVKHYGTHSCSPIKQIKSDEILRELSATSNKAANARRNILFSMIKEGADYESVADKASKLMDR